MVTVQTGSTFNQYALGNSPDIIQDQTLMTAWGENKRDAALVALLSMLQTGGRFGQAIKAKTPQWAIGDYPDEATTLGATVVFDDTVGTPYEVASWKTGSDAGTAGVISLAADRFMAEDMVYMHNGTNCVQFRLGNKISGTSGAYIYAISSVVYTDIPDAGGVVSFTTTTAPKVMVVAPAVTYDDEARDFLNVKPSLLSNQMQRFRETIGSGKWERGETFLADHSITRQTRLGFKSFARKINRALYANGKSVAPAATTSEDYGVMGGFDYFLNPMQASSGVASTSYKGVNKVDSGTSITMNNLVAWAEQLFVKGSDEKYFFCSPAMATLLQKAAATEIALQRPSYGVISPGYDSVWNAPVLELFHGRLRLIVDYGLTGFQKTVKDNTTTSTQANSLYWGLAIDPTDVGLVPFIPDGEGAQTPQIKPITQTRNNSTEEYEFDATMTLAVGDPELHGFYGITNAS